MSFLIGSVCLIFASIMAPNFIRVKRDEALPILMNCIVILLYVGAWTGNINVGIYSVYFVFIILFVLSVFVKKHRRSTFEAIKDDLNLYIVNLIIVIFVFLFHYGRTLYWVDEFSFWGASVKQLFFSGKLYCDIDSAIMFREYTPALPLFEYFFLAIPHVYSEDVLYMAYTFWCFVLIYSVLYNKKQKKLEFVCVPIIVYFCTMIIGVIPAFYSILSDMFMAIFAASLFYRIAERKISEINLFSSLFVMSLVKPSSICFAIFILIFYLILEKKGGDRYFVQGIVSVVLIIVAKLSWQIILGIHKVEMEVSGLESQSVFSIIKNIFFNTISSHQRELIQNFFSGIFAPYVSNITGTLSLGSFFVIYLIGAYIITKKVNKECMFFFLFYLIVLFIMVIGTLMTCLTKFDAVLSLNRYIGSFIYCGILFELFVLCNSAKISNIWLIIILFCMMDVTKINDGIFLARNYKYKWNNWANNMFIPDEIDENGNILFICQYHNASSAWDMFIKCKYMNIPSHNSFYYSRMLSEDETEQLGATELRDAIIRDNIDYIYLYSIQESFDKDKYGECFSDDIVNNTWWEIENKSDDIIFYKIK